MLKSNLVEGNHSNCDALKQAILELVEKATRMYGAAAVEKIGRLYIEFFDKGRDAAIAVRAKSREDGSFVSVLQFSMHLTVNNIKGMIAEIVPHEYAHILCMANGWDDGHGANWKKVCRDLGGNGETHHHFATIDGRLKNLYEAVSEAGIAYWLTAKQMKMAKSTGIEVQDAEGRKFTLGKSNITGVKRKI